INISLPYSTHPSVTHVLICFHNFSTGTFTTYLGGGVLVRANNTSGGALNATLRALDLSDGPHDVTNSNNTSVPNRVVTVSGIQPGPSFATSRRLFRRFNGSGA